MTREIKGMSVLVTGGGSGIGAAVVARLVAGGARVTLSGRRAERVAEVAERAGPGALAVAGDVSVAADRQRMLDAAVEHGGGLELLVHGAGNMYRGKLDELDEASLVDVFTSNTIAPMLLTGLALSHLRRSRGAVVFFGSVHTQRAFPGASPYAATKGALEALTGVLAAELGPQGVRVSCVRPAGCSPRSTSAPASSTTPRRPSGCAGWTPHTRWAAAARPTRSRRPSSTWRRPSGPRVPC